MTSNQFQVVNAAERWRRAGMLGDTPMANTWRRITGGHETFCFFCGEIHVHADVSGSVLNEQRSCHCLLQQSTITMKGYHLKLLPGNTPDEVRAAARVWGTVHRASGYKYTADQMINEAREKYKAETMAS
jgi:hypothetical protein